MKHLPAIVVITLMPPKGETGVQTHFNEIIKEARRRGFDTVIIHPYDYNVIARKAGIAVSRFLRLINQEIMVLWTRWIYYYFIRKLLRRYLSDLKYDEIILYAQDPLSAKAALKERINSNQSVTSAVHFNISEAYECKIKGITSEGGILYRNLMAIERSTLPMIDKILFLSHFMEKTVYQRIPEIRNVPCSVISNFYGHIKEKAILEDIEGEILSVGTLENRKNQAFILKVLAVAKMRGHSYRLTLIGDGPNREYLKNLAKKLGISKKVNFAGFKANAAKYMATHRVYANSSLMENMPLTLIEALSYGRPILAPAVGGIPEIFSDGREGYFWKLGNIEDAADKMCEILEDKNLCNRMSKAAKDRYSHHFSRDVLSECWISELVNRKKSVNKNIQCINAVQK